jgi:hypothetical protein
MLWSWPSRAHRPIVPGANLTFADARMSAASDREIQSDGGFDIYQSGSFAADPPAADALDEEGWLEPLLVDDSVEPLLEAGAGLSLESAFCSVDSLDSLAPGLPDFPDGSLRAQPLPLKCTAGAEMAFLITP